MRTLSSLLLTGLLLTGFPVNPTSLLWGDASPEKVPLDLPSGGSGRSDDEEDAPEVITFFGSHYEGDGFFFLLDKSGSMAGEKISLLKEELAHTINSLGSQSRFGIVAFSNNVVQFSAIPMLATPLRKSQAVAWVQALQPVGSTHMLDGAVQILQIASFTPSGRRVVIAVGDGLPNQPDAPTTLEGILLANWENLPFNTILFGQDPPAVSFMQDLAQATGGSFQNDP